MADQAKPLGIVRAIALLLMCQLAGEALVLVLKSVFGGFAFPGPVAGMAIFFIWLLVRGGPSRDVEAVSDGLLRNLSLLFVPAAVGIVQYGPLLAEVGLALVVALLVSTVLTLVVTVGVFILVNRWAGESDAR